MKNIAIFQIGLITCKLVNCPDTVYSHLKEFKIARIRTKVDFDIEFTNEVKHVPFHAFQFVLRDKIQAYFAESKNGFIIHSSAIEVGGKAHIFLGDNSA